MLLLENKKQIQKTKVMPLPSSSITKDTRKIDKLPKKDTRKINKIPKKQISSISLNTFYTLFNFKTINSRKHTVRRNLSDPGSVELELTPQAKKIIKAILSPIAVIPYILQESSVALNKALAATTSFLMFSLLNCFTSVSFGSYEVKLPMLSVCMLGSILGAKRMIKAMKKIILSVPTGVHTCSQNISCYDCSIFDFICGVDRRKKNLIHRFFKLS